MKRFVFASTAALGLASGALAQSDALTFVESGASCGANSDQSVGWQFNVNTAVTVTALTWHDEGGNGLQVSHEVGLWDPAGNLIAGPVVVSSSSPINSEGWRSVSINPVVLNPGSGYIVGGFNGSGQTECLFFNVPTQTVNPSLTYIDATFSGLNGIFERPTNFSSAVTGFYGPGFQVGEAFSIDYNGSCPGSVSVDASGATAGGSVALVFAANTGNYIIPGGFTCGGTQLGLGSAGIRLVQVRTADGNGDVTFSGSAPVGACGGYVQAIDVSTCETSNVEQIN